MQAFLLIALVGYSSWRVSYELENASRSGRLFRSGSADAGRSGDSVKLWPVPNEAQRSFCDAHFGKAWLSTWNESAKTICRTQAAQSGPFLNCRCACCSQSYAHAISCFMKPSMKSASATVVTTPSLKGMLMLASEFRMLLQHMHLNEP